jgi:hypothetical protein
MDFKLYLIVTILIILLNMSKSPRVDPLRETITEEDQRAFIKCHVLLGDPQDARSAKRWCLPDQEP